MAKVRQARRCSARRSTDGQPCRGWAIIGGFVCAAHGGSAPAVRHAAYDRVERERMMRHVRTEVERIERRRIRLLAGELVDVARVLGEPVESVERDWPLSKWLAYKIDPAMSARHERRRRRSAEEDAARQRRWTVRFERWRTRLRTRRQVGKHRQEGSFPSSDGGGAG